MRAWLSRIGVKTLCIEPRRPGENGYDENFNGKLRDELLNSDILYALKEAQVLIERWRQDYNTVRPRSSSGYRPPGPQAVVYDPTAPAYARLQPAQQGPNQRTILS